ncbi:hypothetical protein [Serratia aquatilis]|uniref:hypothetical protein n=1 Tax=Serratia aquatilis TaxID=1737515 RepID=UPI0036D3BCDA
MSTCKFACISASIGLMLLVSAPFASGASGGVIHFTGAIVDSGCTFNNTQRSVNIGCYKGGKEIQTKASINSSKINFAQGTVTGIKWLNTKHTLGIMNVSYH